MKRVAILLLVVATSACALGNKGGARGPNIQRTNVDTAQTASDPSTGSVDRAVDLNR